MLLITAGALLLLLPWFGGLASGELSNKKLKMCQKFFYNKIPPQGFGSRTQAICQRYKNQYRFATLYDRESRTALYSAYLLSPTNGKRPDDPWMYEPQLAFKRGNREMQPFLTPVNQDVIRSQAVLEDYARSNYTKGHLAPSLHLNTMEDREASFTLTNIVPQMNCSNSGTWRDLEEKVLKRFKKDCNGTMYVITGTIPYKSVYKLNNRVSIPEYIWSAYCCPSFRADLPENEKHYFPTYAAVGRNDPKSGNEIVKKNDASPFAVREMSLKKMQFFLRKRLKMKDGDRLFFNDCPASKP